MKYSLAIITLITIFGFNGCSYKDGVTTTEQRSYLYFTGNVDDAQVSIDNSAKFTVEAGKNHQYQIGTGKHLVTIYKGNRVIVNREIFVSDGVAKEIEIKE